MRPSHQHSLAFLRPSKRRCGRGECWGMTITYLYPGPRPTRWVRIPHFLMNLGSQVLILPRRSSRTVPVCGYTLQGPEHCRWRGSGGALTLTELGSSMQIRFQKSINCVHASVLPLLATFGYWTLARWHSDASRRLLESPCVCSRCAIDGKAVSACALHPWIPTALTLFRWSRLGTTSQLRTFSDRSGE